MLPDRAKTDRGKNIPSRCLYTGLPNSTHPTMMPPSDQPPSPRPLKRPRKSNPDPEPEWNAPLDHIFIADGIHTKKAGKKVRGFLLR